MTFRLLVVPGIVIDRWRQTWAERRPAVPLQLVQAPAADAQRLLGTDGDAALLRLPVDRDKHHAIPLYTEQSVVLAHRDHVLHAADELTLAEIAELGEPLLRPLDDVLSWDSPASPGVERPETTEAAVEWVAAEVGLLVVPQSLARLYHRKDVKYKPVTDGPESAVALAWPVDGHSELVEEMIGIVRGRTANSTRGQVSAAPARRKGPASRGTGSPARRPR
ncbi:LysR family transcriptional regulator substrate-binding protein [Dactylosporangium vinaceum]|uniref:LysR family transcriptional regulator substrate-binding protein n=1 Tax=Dactylosporangium vinaceum TaxID=53362 RepID=A0ABV5MA04_9ACTN|nr:LysR family transcriptional regulator substrate-binding protein [Dactylosporangium vinaceum]UAB93133.1 LysR family transcriptional regulator substrate-binding protein [Dactylosporangium vinaceum]